MLNPDNTLGDGAGSFGGNDPETLSFDLVGMFGDSVRNARYVRVSRTPDTDNGGSTDDQNVLSIAETKAMLPKTGEAPGF